MIAGAYCRKSTDEGDRSEDAKSVRLQQDKAREYASRKGWTLDDRYVFSDDGISGAEFKRRPGLQKLIAALTPRPKFDILVVSEVSRLGRDTSRTIGLIQDLQDAGVHIWAYLDDREITLASDMGEIEVFFRAFSAADASRKGSQRTSAGLRRNAAQGRPTGGTTFGYTNGVINPAQAKVVRRVFTLYASGLGLHLVCKALEADKIAAPQGGRQWHISEIAHLLRNETYIGVDVYGRTRQVRKGGTWVTVASPEPAVRTEHPELRIIDDALWRKVEARLRERGGENSPRRSRADASRWLLTKFIACGFCGSSLSVNKGSGSKPYYTCTRSRRHRKLCPKSRAVPVDKADRAFLEKFEHVLKQELRLGSLLARLEADGHALMPVDPSKLEARKATLTLELKRLVERFARGASVADEAIATRTTELRQVEADLQRATLLWGPHKLKMSYGRGRMHRGSAIKDIPGLDLEAFERRIAAQQRQWLADMRADPLAAKSVMARLLPERVKVTPSDDGWRFDGMVDYSAVLKDAGFETLALVVEDAKGSRTRGVGWMKEEVELFGVPYARRGAWSDEAIRVMKTCWRDARASHRGEFLRFEALGVAPKPARGTIPVWIGGHTPRALRRVAELGDGWHAAFPSAAKMKAGLADLATACRQVGRDMASLTISARLGLPARQDVDALVREIRDLAGLGVSHVILESRVRDLDDMTAIYEKFARDVRPRI